MLDTSPSNKNGKTDKNDKKNEENKITHGEPIHLYSEDELIDSFDDTNSNDKEGGSEEDNNSNKSNSHQNKY